MAHNLRMQIFPSFKMQFSLKKTKNQKQNKTNYYYFPFY